MKNIESNTVDFVAARAEAEAQRDHEDAEEDWGLPDDRYYVLMTAGGIIRARYASDDSAAVSEPVSGTVIDLSAHFADNATSGVDELV